MADIYRDRRRAESFGDRAERYDRTRPSYPVELIDWLTDGSPGTAVDVGCGTGQVALMLMAAGWAVVGVDADPRMADVARRNGVDVDVSSFEQWHPARDDFDLVCSGQAWHWIDPDAGYRKAAALLRPGGRLAVFWNAYRYDETLMQVFSDVLGSLAPDLFADSVFFGTASVDHAEADSAAVRRCADAFAEVEFHVFTHDRDQTVEQWLEEAVTHSPVAMLTEDVRAQVFSELASRLDVATGTHIRVTYQTRLTCAHRTCP